MRNRKGIFLLMVMTLFAFLGTATAGQFGAPEPVANNGKLSLGVGYFYNSDKLNVNSGDFKYSQNQIYLQLSAALNKMEFYIRGGGRRF